MKNGNIQQTGAPANLFVADFMGFKNIRQGKILEMGLNPNNTAFVLKTPKAAFCLNFVVAFSVFPSAVLLGEPSEPTRVIPIAAYQWAFEKFDFKMSSTISLIMAGIELLIISIVLFALNICGILFTVILNSLIKGWYPGLVPGYLTGEWYVYIAKAHDIPNLVPIVPFMRMLTLPVRVRPGLWIPWQ